MTNETNAALSALKLALDGIGQMPFGCSLSAMQSRYLGEAYRAFHTIAASQREAPVAEGETDSRALYQIAFDLEDVDAKGDWPEDISGIVDQLRFVARRLAERPSVTNVSREAMEKAFLDARYLATKAGSEVPVKAGLDAVYALIQSAAPAPGKAADEGVEALEWVISGMRTDLSDKEPMNEKSADWERGWDEACDLYLPHVEKALASLKGTLT